MSWTSSRTGAAVDTYLGARRHVGRSSVRHSERRRNIHQLPIEKMQFEWRSDSHSNIMGLLYILSLENVCLQSSAEMNDEAGPILR